jgi:hypothetical protein
MSRGNLEIILIAPAVYREAVASGLPSATYRASSKYRIVTFCDASEISPVTFTVLSALPVRMISSSLRQLREDCSEWLCSM